MISTCIPTEENAWLIVTEWPDGTLCLEGIRLINGEFASQRIRFSLKAVKELVPLMQEWLN